MAKKLFVITASSIVKTGTQGYGFMFQSGANMEAVLSLGNVPYGRVDIEEKWDGEYDFQVFLGTGTDQTFYAGMIASLDEAGQEKIGKLFLSMPDSVVMMEIEHYLWFEEAAKKAGVDISVHHSNKILATG